MINMATQTNQATEKQRARLKEYGYADNDIDKMDTRSAQTAIIKTASNIKRHNNAEVANSGSTPNIQTSHASKPTNDDMPKTEAEAIKPNANDAKAHNTKWQESVEQTARPDESPKNEFAQTSQGSVSANPTPAKQTFLDIAELVLREAKKPLTYREITERALLGGLIKTNGKTPAATMSASLSVDVKKEQSRFIKNNDKTYYLR